MKNNNNSLKRLVSVSFSSLLTLYILLSVTACSQEPQEVAQENDSDSELLLHVPSPEWQDQVIYFLMTDRFNDGDPGNNDQGIGEYNPKKSSHYSGGDLQGVIEQLDYIQNMGMTAVWTTPWVANQWWSNETNYGGYHGYWALNFSEVDPHLGTKETLKRLSDQLHRRDMYLVQDIVVNHTANLFNYRNGHDGYNPDDTSQNFYLFEEDSAPQSKPTQSPFDLFDRNNPEHVKADIYNWTPSIQDYKNVAHQYTYQLARLADINTRNPLVVDKFKEIYGNWIKEIGVDAFRIDTVRYVEHEFFHHFMHDDDGIHASAKETGRDNFLAFGEVFDVSKAYENDAEKRVASYLGSTEKPELNAQISFPLYADLTTVFAQGYPTDQLAYRIKQHMEIYPNPYVFPTFIDNHDMSRFLSSGDVPGLKQALTTIFTIPGIPTIYQGTAQAMKETRSAMFKGGYGAKEDAFDQTTELYQFIKTMASLRTSDKLFTRGDLAIIASDTNGPGILAYKRSYKGREVIILMNTSSKRILVNQIKVSDESGVLNPIYGSHDTMQLDAKGLLTAELDGRAIVIAELVAAEQTPAKSVAPTIGITSKDSPIREDVLISGTVNYQDSPLLLVKNNQLETAVKVNADEQGDWEYTYPVKNLGSETVSLIAYQPDKQLVSVPVSFETEVANAEFELRLTDPVNDDTGPDGKYLAPQHPQSIGQMDILSVEAQVGGDVLALTFTMRELSNNWIPPNGFDNVAFSIYFDVPEKSGLTILPYLNAYMPSSLNWDFGHVVYGWSNSTFSSAGATNEDFGKKFGIAPEVTVDKAAKTIRFLYNKVDFGVADWRGSHIFVTTWDITGEGVYRTISSDPSEWSFSGGNSNDPKILDSMLITLE